MKNRHILLLIGIIIFAIILAKIDWHSMIAHISKADYTLIAMAFLLNIPAILIKAIRLRSLMRIQGLDIEIKKIFLICFSSLFFGVITPGRLGELTKILYLKKEGVTSLSFGLSSVIVDRCFDMVFLLLFGFIGCVFMFSFAVKWDTVLVALILIAIAAYFFIRVVNFHENFSKKLLIKLVPRKLHYNLSVLLDGFVQLKTLKLWRAAFLTVISYAIFFVQCYIIALAIGIKITFLLLIPIMAIANLVSFLPISISGLGTRDAALLFLLTHYHNSPEAIITYSFGVLFVFYVGSIFFGVISWVILHFSNHRKVILERE
ncbi:MAG: lysylphosphatidylglycerol synthase transmembrane domain-containing protein [Gammaproteobacteria bacterium]|jgi:uncharacterized protein (TIRG00374 family)